MHQKINQALLISGLLLFSTQIWASCVGLNCTCVIATNGLAFGNYDAGSASPDDSTSTVTVTCSALILGGLISYEIQLSTGGSGTYTSRTMLNGANQLNYNIYTTSGRTQVWGDGTGSTATISDSYLLSLFSQARNYTAFGRIPTAQFVPPGSYTDTVTATVIF